MLRQAAPTGVSRRSAGLKSRGAGGGVAENAVADGFELAARDLQQQLFAAGFPVQFQGAVGGDDGGAVGVGVDAVAAAFDAGAAAQRHLHQHEVLQAVGFDVDFRAVAQRTDAQGAEAGAVQFGVDAAALPGQAVILERFGDAFARFGGLGGTEDASFEQWRQLDAGPAVHGCLRDGNAPVSPSSVMQSSSVWN